jgi:hypothetical protein
MVAQRQTWWRRATSVHGMICCCCQAGGRNSPRTHCVRLQRPGHVFSALKTFFIRAAELASLTRGLCTLRPAKKAAPVPLPLCVLDALSEAAGLAATVAEWAFPKNAAAPDLGQRARAVRATLARLHDSIARLCGALDDDDGAPPAIRLVHGLWPSRAAGASADCSTAAAALRARCSPFAHLAAAARVPGSEPAEGRGKRPSVVLRSRNAYIDRVLREERMRGR